MEEYLRSIGLLYKLFGDSAYYACEYMSTNVDLPGRGLSSVRETIEWCYKDIKMLWKYCDYKHVLQMRKQPVAKIMFVCMLLRNAYVTMNASQTSEYFLMMTPTSEDWTSQGQIAKTLPNNCVFSPNYEIPESDIDDDSDEELDGEIEDD